MTMNYFILAAIAFLPMTAVAQPRDAGSLLRGSLQALGQAGFAEIQGVPMPQAPSTVAASPTATPQDETAQAVAALVDAVQKTGVEGTFVGAVLRKVGLAFNGEVFPFKNIQVIDLNLNLIRNFTVTSIRGQNGILLQSVAKSGINKKLRSYLISAEGKLLGAAVSWKENGAYLTDSIPLADAEVDYREQLDFWMRYYRANLKKP